MKYVFELKGTGTIEEVQQAMSDAAEALDRVLEEAEGREDSLTIGFPMTELEERKKKFHLTIKLK
jgi:hypothetical protein